MKNGIRWVIFLFLAVMPGIRLLAQTSGSRNVSITLPTVALLDIEPSASKNVSMIFSGPTEAGNPLASPVNNTTLWINYTSAVNGATRAVYAKINTTIPGVDIKLTAGAASGSGGGVRGTSSGQKTLSTVNQTIISGIGGAYTGQGINNGHRLTISVSPNTYANLSTGTTNIQVTYTLSN